MMIHAVSGIDMAVHDAAARSLDIPVCELLGGRFRDEVKVYVSSIWVDGDDPGRAYDDVMEYVDLGYKGAQILRLDRLWNSAQARHSHPQGVARPGRR